jgi:hypothetical protein
LQIAPRSQRSEQLPPGQLRLHWLLGSQTKSQPPCGHSRTQAPPARHTWRCRDGAGSARGGRGSARGGRGGGRRGGSGCATGGGASDRGGRGRRRGGSYAGSSAGGGSLGDCGGASVITQAPTTTVKKAMRSRTPAWRAARRRSGHAARGTSI